MIDNPQVVKFCNEGLRIAADKLSAAYFLCKSLVASYDATKIAELLGEDDDFNELIDDGSALDGRPPISAGGAKLTIENIRLLLKQLDETQTPSGLSLAQGILSISPRYAKE